VLTGLFDVRDQVALVTGGASGLGYAFASILADCGAVVVVADWNAERLEKAAASLGETAAAPVRAAAAHMKKQRSGSIVVTASTAGLRNDPFTPYSYAVAKAGIVNFTKQAAHDLARWNVRVNAVAPGPFKTNLGGGGPMPPEAEARWNAVVPLGRMGDPAEIRGLALLLASKASSFMTGGVYPVDGGALLQGPALPPAG
jgi:NAD(P)-dependent dehydrogenase (short-subunit alcohol dehydrogenase family)